MKKNLDTMDIQRLQDLYIKLGLSGRWKRGVPRNVPSKREYA